MTTYQGNRAAPRTTSDPAGLPAFLSAYPGYPATGALDELRAAEYGYLDAEGHVYLDYTGAGLPADAQLRAHAARLRGRCFGNPHSESPTSAASTELIEQARTRVLSYFNASPAEYAAIFTPNATGACRLVGEAYPFGSRTRYLLTYDNHNSVNGIREFARARGAVTEYLPFSSAELRVDDEMVAVALARSRPDPVTAAWRVARSGSAPWAGRGIRARRQREMARGLAGHQAAPDGRRSAARCLRGLFAFPAQSNFTGVQHPLRWIDLAHELGYDVLLDAAAYVPANRLDLSVVHPDFVPVSWYKVFGYPTGAGCLLARREALARLRRPWFSGGTILAVSVQGDWHALASDETAFEDGTPSFLGIPDVEFGLSWIESIGMDVIHQRVSCLTGWLLDRLGSMRHSSGAPMVRIYGPAGTQGRGGTIAFNLLDPDGSVVDERAVARDTARAGISIRTGCFCNPGAGEGMFDLSKADVTGSIRRGVRTVDEYIELLGMPSAGAIRASLGLASTFTDAQRLLGFVETTYRDRPADLRGLAPRLRC